MTTTDPYEGPRPSEEHEPGARPPSFWATVDRPHERKVSGSFDNLTAAIRWTHANMAHAADEPNVWQRTVAPNGLFTDEHVWPDLEPAVVRDHLAVLTRSLSEVLSGAKRRRDRESTGRKGSGHVRRPDKPMDARTPMLSYDEVYDEEGHARFRFGEDGWPIRDEETKR